MREILPAENMSASDFLDPAPKEHPSSGLQKAKYLQGMTLPRRHHLGACGGSTVVSSAEGAKRALFHRRPSVSVAMLSLAFARGSDCAEMDFAQTYPSCERRALNGRTNLSTSP